MCCVSCLETFSNNVTVPGLTPIPLNSISIAKGEFISGNKGASSVEFNKCGVYKVSVSAVAVGSEEGDITIQLYKDNVAIQNALATSTVSTTKDSIQGSPIASIVSLNSCLSSAFLIDSALMYSLPQSSQQKIGIGTPHTL